MSSRMIFEVEDFEQILQTLQKPLEKHQQHDQQSHGNWASGDYQKIGGAGIDITEDLKKIFNDPKTIEQLTSRMKMQLGAGKKPSDTALDLIVKLQGFDDKPRTTQTLAELNDLEKTGEYITVYRGVTDFSVDAYESGKGDENSEISQSANKSIKDFTEGEYFSGQGIHGSGTYTSKVKDTADSYAVNMDESEGVFNNGKTIKILIPKNIKMPSMELVKKVNKDVASFWMQKFKNGAENVPPSHENNVGRKLASLGYQAYFGASDFHLNNIIILDRSAVIVSKEPVTNYEGFAEND